jgi:hypothetical protein
LNVTLGLIGIMILEKPMVEVLQLFALENGDESRDRDQMDVENLQVRATRQRSQVKDTWARVSRWRWEEWRGARSETLVPHMLIILSLLRPD